MLKTFVVSPLVGAVAVLLGWIGALLAVESMDEATFASLRFGWAGLLIGATALAVFATVMVAGGGTDPLVATVVAGVGVALLWNHRELPFATQNFEQGTSAAYWYIVTMMLVVFVLLLVGLRAARETNNRARR